MGRLNNLECYNSQRGFSLPAVIIGASMMSAMAVAFSVMITQMNTSVGYLEDRASALDLKNSVAMDLSTSQACINSIGNLPVSNEQRVASIRNPANQVVYSPNQSYDRLNIAGIRLQNVNLPAAPNSTGRMNLLVDLNRQRLTGPVSMRPGVIPIQATTNAASRIIDCMSVADGGGSGTPPAAGPACSNPSGAAGATRTESRGATTNTDGYRRVYLCSSGRWVMIENERLPSRG